jgi:hypothetical protein
MMLRNAMNKQATAFFEVDIDEIYGEEPKPIKCYRSEHDL